MQLIHITVNPSQKQCVLTSAAVNLHVRQSGNPEPAKYITCRRRHSRPVRECCSLRSIRLAANRATKFRTTSQGGGAKRGARRPAKCSQTMLVPHHENVHTDICSSDPHATELTGHNFAAHFNTFIKWYLWNVQHVEMLK